MVLATRALLTGAFGPDATLHDVALTAAPNGGWPGETGAVHRDGRTFVGYIDGAGNVEVISVEDGVVGGPFTLHASLEVDHHDYPELLVREDGHLVAVYSKHNGSELYRRVSTSPLDASSWESETDIDSQVGESQYTYPRLRQLTAEDDDPLYLFVRSGGGSSGPNKLSMSKSTDGGANWGTAATIWQTTPGHYFRVFESGGSRIDLLVGTGNAIGDDGDLYHLWYEGGDWFDSEGNDIGDPPFGTSDATLVYDAPNGQGVRLPRSVERLPDGRVVGLFVTFGEVEAFDYHWAEWDGSSWSTERIAEAAASVGGFGGGGSHWGPYAYVSIPDGGTDVLWRFRRTPSGWQGRPVSTGVYPVPVRCGAHPLRMVWLDGEYVEDPYSYSWGIRGGW